jgi:DNA repair ATPase RecN
MNSSISNKRKIEDVDNDIDTINSINNINIKKSKSCEKNFLNFLYNYFPKDYVQHVKELLSQLIDFNSLSEYVSYSFVYYCIKFLSYLKSMNEMNSYLKEYNNNKNNIVKSFNYLKNIFQLIESKKELVSQITVIDNKINSDQNTIKELSKNLVSINLDIIGAANKANKVDEYIQEYVKINYDISLIIEKIDKNSSIKRNLEKDVNTIFDDINKVKSIFIRINNYYINNHNLMNKIFTLSRNLSNNCIILKLVKNKISQQLNDDTKNKFTKIFASLHMYNNILNNFPVNEKDTELFNEINDNINHYDENIESCHCNKCKKIALYKTIYHDLLVKYDTRKYK